MEPPGTERAANRAAVPRWVKTLGIVLAALLLLLLLAMAILGGEHGPGRHRPSLLTQEGAAVPGVLLTIGAR